MEASPRLFIVGTQYAIPDYQFRLHSGAFPVFQHPSGVRVQIGQTPDGSPACAAESDEQDADVLDLLRLDRAGSLDEASFPELWRFSRRVRQDHRAAAESVVRTLRWITRRDEGGTAIGVRQASRWSEDGSEWHTLPVGDPPFTDVGWGVFEFDEAWRVFVAQLLAAGEAEPLAHELLQEALALLDTNPRSCLVIAVSALEVGVKQHVIRMGGTIRGASRGPDLFALLNQSIPRMRTERWKELPTWLKARLNRSVAARNRLIHSGEPPPPRDELQAIIRGVRDVLYLLDWQFKHDWALAYVSFLAGDMDGTGPQPVFRLRMQLV